MQLQLREYGRSLEEQLSESLLKLHSRDDGLDEAHKRQSTLVHTTMSDILDLQSSISDSNAKHAILEKHNDFLRKTMGECVDSSDDLQNQVASLKAEVAAQKEGTLRALSTQDRFTRQKMDGLLQVPPSPPPPTSLLFHRHSFLPFISISPLPYSQALPGETEGKNYSDDQK